MLVPRQILAQDDGLVQMARRSASSGNITVQKLCGNIGVLMGAGGNIAVLPGPDGKLLIDAGFAGSRPKITEALASISSDPPLFEGVLRGPHLSRPHQIRIRDLRHQSDSLPIRLLRRLSQKRK